MAFQAGIVNAGGFLACHRFVTHTTGFATYFGTETARGNWTAAIGMLSVPFFFLIGAMISAYFVDRRLAIGRRPLYHYMFAFISLTMLIIAVTGYSGLFGTFGEAYESSRDYLLLALLCLTSGIQNATISSASGAVIRTSHLTGITTDLGIGMVRVLSTGQSDKIKSNEHRANGMRISLIVAFGLGSTIGALLFYRIQYWGFVGPAFISFALFVLSLKKLKSQDAGAPRA